MHAGGAAAPAPPPLAALSARAGCPPLWPPGACPPPPGPPAPGRPNEATKRQYG